MVFRILTLLNTIILLAIIYAIMCLYSDLGDIGSAMVYMAKTIARLHGR